MPASFSVELRRVEEEHLARFGLDRVDGEASDRSPVGVDRDRELQLDAVDVVEHRDHLTELGVGQPAALGGVLDAGAASVAVVEASVVFSVGSAWFLL